MTIVFTLKLKSDKLDDENITDTRDYYLECLNQAKADADDDAVESIEVVINTEK